MAVAHGKEDEGGEGHGQAGGGEMASARALGPNAPVTTRTTAATSSGLAFPMSAFYHRLEALTA